MSTQTYKSKAQSKQASQTLPLLRITPVSLDTLAQLRGTPKISKILSNRARSKAITNAIVRKLVDLNTPLKQSYWNTFHCSSVMIQEGKTITSTYCNNRWCLVCNRIRTAKLIKGYTPELTLLKDKKFVTLTIPNCPEAQLRDKMKLMHSTIRTIKERMRRKGRAIKGIRKYECTYNSKTNEYHPHFHFIIEGKFDAELLRDEWLKIFPNASKQAQDIRDANDDSIIELFKYSTKMILKIDGQTTINPMALDVIYQSMKGKRIFQPMGIKKVVSEDIDKIEKTEYDIEPTNETTVLKWEDNCNDWINMLTGDFVSCYSHSTVIREMIDRINGT